MDRQTKAIIATLLVAAFMVGTDFTGAMMLVTPIELEYGADITTTQWVLNIYALTFAMLLVTAGRLGDMFGRRRLLLVGLGIFLPAALVCTIAPTIGWLIGARGVQGIGAAIIWPCLLAIGATSVPDQQRPIFFGLFLGAVGIGNVISPFLAGILGGLGQWRMFFLFNVIFAALSLLLVLRFVPSDAAEDRHERIDYAGMATLALAVLALLYALDVGADWGWTSPPIIALFVASAVLFAAFPFVENWVRDPMVPLAMMRNRNFVAALSMNGLIAPALFLLLLYVPQFLHKVSGWSVLWAAVGTLPLLGVLTTLSLTVGRFYMSVGPRRLLSIGHAIVVLGMAWTLFIRPEWGFWGLLPTLLLMGIGGGMVFAPAGTAAVNAADPSRAGLAGGLSYMFHLGLGAIGVGAGTALMFTGSLNSLAAGLKAIGVAMDRSEQLALNAAAPSGKTAQEILQRYGAEEGGKIIDVSAQAFTTGLQHAFWLALAFAVLGLIVALSLDDSKLKGMAAPEASG